MKLNYDEALEKYLELEGFDSLVEFMNYIELMPDSWGKLARLLGLQVFMEVLKDWKDEKEAVGRLEGKNE